MSGDFIHLQQSVQNMTHLPNFDSKIRRSHLYSAGTRSTCQPQQHTYHTVPVCLHCSDPRPTHMHELQTWSVARQTRLELPTELHSSRHNNVCLPPRVLSLRDLLHRQLTSPLARRLLPPSTPAQLPSHLPTSRPHLRVSLRSRSRSTLMLVRLPLTRLLTGLSPML
jgi:hypothetical protein